MAETTNLGLKTYDNPSTNENPVDIENNWNGNWEKVDEAYGNLNKNKVEKEDGKGLSTNDFTNTDKEKLDGLKNYDDTEIKQDIEDIKDEQETQNHDIDALKAQKKALEKEVESLREDAKLNGLTEDNEGELVHIDNSTGSRFNSLEIEGNDKQETREGYNTFNVLGLSIENQDAGVTITRNEDGSITANGTPTRAWAVFLRDNKIGDKLEDGQTYTLWQENYSDVKYGGIYLQVTAKPIAGGADTYIEASNQKKTFKVDKSKYTYQSCIQISTLEAAGVFENYKNRYMIYKGTDDKEFELYGAMPSFDYPSEIKVVGDNINLFSTDFYDDFSNNSDATHETIDDMIKVSTSSINQFSGIFLYTLKPNIIELDNIIKGKTVTYSFEAKADDNIDLSFGKSGNSFIRQVKKEWRKYSVTYPNTSSSSIYFYNNSATVTNFYIRKIKLEYGEIDSSYSPHELGSVGLKIFNKNFNDNVFEIGTILDDTGKEGISKNYIRNKNYLRLDSGDYIIFAYKFSGISILNTAIRLYDRNKKYLKSLYIGRIDANVLTFKITEDVGYGRLVCLNNEAVSSDFSVEIQIEKGTNKTDYVEHEEQTYVIPVQQRMFSGDKFVKVDGIWKEMHTIGTVYSKDISNIVVNGSAVSGVEGFYRYNVNLGISNRKGGSYIRLYSNYFKYADSRWHKEEGICGWENGQIFCIGTYNKNFDTAEKLKTFLTENNVEIAYELAKPIYLDCTDEQIVVLDKIEQEAKTYEEVTNIYTEDEVGAVLKTNTAVDLKSVINNIQEQLIAG